MSVPWREQPGGVALTVRVTPRGGRDAIDGVEFLADGRPVLKLRVRVAPEDGQANRAAARLLADALDLPLRAVRLTSGDTARIKQFAVDGETAVLLARLEKLAAANG